MFDRIVSHERALEAASRLINSHFGGADNKRGVRASIPASEDDDDIVITDYIMQQKAKEAERKSIPTERMQPAGGTQCSTES